MMPTVFLDMDGVLVNFVQGALDHLESDVCISTITWDFPKDVFGYPDAYHPDFWAKFAFHDFWANLKWTDEGKRLLKEVEDMVGQRNIGLLTTPMDIDGCTEGKRTWIKNNLPAYKKQVMVGGAKYLMAAKGKILLDDHDPNILSFSKTPEGKSTGGQGILVPRPWNSGKPRTVGKAGFGLDAVLSELRWTLQQTV